MQKIVTIQNTIQQLLKTFDGIQQNVDIFSHSIRQNNRKIFSFLRKMFDSNLSPLRIILIHLTDNQLLTFASTCKTIRKLVFSPFGFKLIKSLRPLVVQVHKIQDEPIVSISMFENQSKSSKQLFHDNDDEDDLQAAVMAMNTNILAIMQKVKQLQKAKKRVNAKSILLVSSLQQEAQQKQFLNQKNKQKQYRIQKQQIIGQDCEKHIDQLMIQQQFKCNQKEDKIDILKKDRDKLLHQKQLLIKKLKAVMAEAEEQKAMSIQVANIMSKLQHILKKK